MCDATGRETPVARLEEVGRAGVAYRKVPGHWLVGRWVGGCLVAKQGAGSRREQEWMWRGV